MTGNRVYIGNIPHDTRERDVEKFCKGFGRVHNVVIKNGYGFVEFEDERDAEEAIDELNGRELLGSRVQMEAARGPSRRFDPFRGPSRGTSRFGPPSRTCHRLLVENLSSGVSWQDLKDCMREAGTVTYADAHKDRWHEGIVEFASYRDLRYAIDRLDGTELKGRRIKLVDQSDEARRSRSRSRSRHRSGSRSRHGKSSRARSRSESRGRGDYGRSRSRSQSH